MEIKELLINLLNYVGGYGPGILQLFSLYLLWQKSNLLLYYILGLFFNLIINLILKGIIQQPRPCDDAKLFNIALKNGKRFVFKDGIPYDIFGMPSGHSQSVFYSTFYIYLTLRDINITIVYSIFSLITIYQRVLFSHHTVMQVIVGGFVGLAVAYSFYRMARRNITGKLREKKDDNAPI